MARYEIVGERSTVVVDARSSMGPITFEARGPRGWVETTVVGDNELDLSQSPVAELEVELASLRSGNELYDAELRRRVDARAHPLARIELVSAEPAGPAGRYRLTGALSFHGRTRDLTGTAAVEVCDGGSRLRVMGEKVVDIRDFAIPAPSILMLKIYPEVRIHLFAEAELGGPPDSPR